MSNTKERVLKIVSVMNDDDVNAVMKFILDEFPNYSLSVCESVVPDKTELRMLKEIDNNPDCSTFISAEEVNKTLDLDRFYE